MLCNSHFSTFIHIVLLSRICTVHLAHHDRGMKMLYFCIKNIICIENACVMVYIVTIHKKKDKCFSQANKFIKVGFWQLDRYFFLRVVLCVFGLCTMTQYYRFSRFIYLHFYFILLLFMCFFSLFWLKWKYLYCCDAIGKRSFLEYNKNSTF